MAFSPDGSRLAMVVDNAIQLFQAVTGKETRRLVDNHPVDDNAFKGNAIAFSQDGRLLVLGTGGFGQPPADNAVRLWDTATGRMLWKVQGKCGPVHSVAVSSQGWVLASGSEGGTIQLRELATGLELLRLEDPGNPVYGVAFAPDGKTVASAMHDATALLWELAPLEGIARVARPVTDLALDKLLADLVSEDGHVMYRALWTLSAFPKETITFLRADLADRCRDRQERLRQLVIDLGAADFERREAAYRKLDRLGMLAQATLKRAMAETKSDEVRSRLVALLQSLENRKFKDVELLLDRRIVWVLERIGSQDARMILQELGKRDSSYSAAEDARIALDRLQCGASKLKNSVP
jgi:WD domain, G-beta repeat